MAYSKTTWENAPSTNTPINANNLNKIEEGIYTNSIDIGEKTNLNTQTKTNVVSAINEINDLSNLTTYDKTSLVNAINEIKGVVVDYIVETATHELEFPISNSKATDIYEMYITGAVSTTNNADIYIRFNDITTGYYSAINLSSTSSTTDTNTTISGTYRANKDAFYAGSSLTGNNLGYMKYEFCVSNGKICIDYIANIFGNNLKGVGLASGTNTNSVDKITKIKLAAGNTNSILFNSGTRILITKK